MYFSILPDINILHSLTGMSLKYVAVNMLCCFLF